MAAQITVGLDFGTHQSKLCIERKEAAIQEFEYKLNHEINKMKPIVPKLCMVIVMLWLSISASAYDFQTNGIYYEITDAVQQTVAVTSNIYYRYNGIITIRAEVEYNDKTYSVTSIGKSAFKGCRDLTSVTIPNSVTSIDDYAFGGCSGLTSITLPNSVTSIEDGAFQECSGLTSITLPNSVTSIGDSAFQGCYGLSSVTIPHSVTSIGMSAFEGCSGLTSVTIPNSVTSIKMNTFYNCRSLTSVTIPNSITSIEEDSFYNCSGLTSVTIPNSVTSIGKRAFVSCSGLTSVTIPNSVTSIEEKAFYNCIGLTSVSISNSVTSIGNYVFSDCIGLMSVNIPNSVTHIGNKAFYNCSGLTSITLPNSVTSIGDSAFGGCSGLTSITLPNSVTSIGTGAFQECSGLTSVSISNSVTSIGDYVFSGCIGLISVNIPNSVIYICDKAFYNCSGLTSVNIPNSVTWIGRLAFSSCASLTSVIIPNSVTSIWYGAFEDCTNLKKSAYPKTLTNPFSYGIIIAYDPNGTIVEDGFIYGPQKSSILFAPYTLAGEYIIPNSVTSIGMRAFGGCSGLTSVTIPNSVTSIGMGAFGGCSGLTSIIIPNSVTTIEDYAFAGCTSLKKSAYPKTLTNPFSYGIGIAYNPNGAIVEDGFIYGPEKSSIRFATYSLTGEYIIPDSVTSIEDYAFYGSDLINAVASYAIEAPMIAENAFEGLYDKATLLFPKNALFSYLGSNWSLFKSLKFTDSDLVFKSHSDGILDYYLLDADSESDKNIAIIRKGEYENLTSVTIPERLNTEDSKRYYVTGIGYAAFKNRNTLKEINFHNKSIVSFIGDAAFEGTSISTISLPTSISHIGKGAFKNSSLNSFTFPTSVTTIEDETFSGCSKLYSFDIPDWVVSIGKSAFNSCSALNTITIPSSVTSIENSTFEGCSHLTSVTIPSSVTSIGMNAFELCSWLTSVIIPNSVTSIGDYAFQNCYNLSSIIIPNSVTEIGKGVFVDCSRLRKSAYPNTLVNPFSDGIAVAYDPKVAIIENEFIYGPGKSSILFAPYTLSGKYIIPNSVTSVEASAFAGCSSLSSIEIGNGIMAIADQAFAECGLSKVVIPPAVESIGNSAFAGNASLKEVAIGPNVKSICDNAFYNTPLDRVYITAPEPPSAPYNAFSRYAAKLYVQGEDAVNAYYDATSCWDRFEGYAMSEPTSLTIAEPIELPAKVGDTITLHATLTPANVDLPYVFWRSTDPEKAYVDNNGVVTLLQDYAEGDDWQIIAETLYYNGPKAVFSLNNNITTGVDTIVGDTTSTIDVYTLQGVQVLRNATREQFENLLVHGVYIIINGKDVKKVAK